MQKCRVQSAERGRTIPEDQRGFVNSGRYDADFGFDPIVKRPARANAVPQSGTYEKCRSFLQQTLPLGPDDSPVPYPFVLKAFDGPSGPWNDQDIGETGLAGSAGFSNGVFTVSGSGADICCTADAFHYAYRRWSGDCVFIIRVTQVDGAEAFA